MPLESTKSRTYKVKYFRKFILRKSRKCLEKDHHKYGNFEDAFAFLESENDSNYISKNKNVRGVVETVRFRIILYIFRLISPLILP